MATGYNGWRGPALGPPQVNGAMERSWVIETGHLDDDFRPRWDLRRYPLQPVACYDDVTKGGASNAQEELDTVMGIDPGADIFLAESPFNIPSEDDRMAKRAKVYTTPDEKKAHMLHISENIQRYVSELIEEGRVCDKVSSHGCTQCTRCAQLPGANI